MAQIIISHVINPSKVEALLVASDFPTKAERQWECKLLDMYTRRKRDVHSRPIKATVVMLERYAPSFPKGKIQQELASSERILPLEFHYDMQYPR